MLFGCIVHMQNHIRIDDVLLMRSPYESLLIFVTAVLMQNSTRTHTPEVLGQALFDP